MKNAWLCLVFAATLGACGGDGDGTKTDTVVRTGSQQGTSGGFADYDGDGVDDMFVGAPYAERTNGVGAVFVYRGDAAGYSAEPDWTLTGDDNFGYQFANVGDLDGDGTDDFAVTAINGDGLEASLCGNVTVYRGGSSGQVLKKLAGEQAMDKFGYSVTGNCDLNADGRKDLVLGATSHSPGPDRYLGGAVYVYFGPDLAETNRVKLGATNHTGILGFSSACGDINNDSLDDLVVSAIWTHGVIWHESKVLAYYGTNGFSPQTDSPNVTIKSTSTHFGDSLAVIDDIDGDDYREIAIGHPYFYAIPFAMPHHSGTVWIVRGGQGNRTVDTGVSPNADILTRVYGESSLERFGTAMAPLGDMDSDGLPELAVSAVHGNAAGATGLANGIATGKVFVFNGKDVNTDGTNTPVTVASPLSRSERDLHYGSFLAPFHRNGPKLLVGAPTADRMTGAVYAEDL